MIKTAVSPISFFNTVVRLNTSQSYEIYEAIAEAHIDAAREFSEENIKPSLELTFSSSEVEGSFPALVKRFQDEVKLCIGTVCTVEQAEQVIKWSKLSREPITVYSPYFINEIKELFANENIKYIPAVTTIEEFESCPSHPFIKVFPSQIADLDNYAKAIAGPFPELLENKRRVTNFNKDLIIADYTIASPNDYLKIREKFMDENIIITIDSPDNAGVKLVEYIRSNAPNVEISTTGITDLSLDSLKPLIEAGAHTIGSGASIKDSLAKICSNQISIREFKEEVQEKLTETYKDLEVLLDE